MDQKRTYFLRLFAAALLLLTLCMPPCSAFAKTGKQVDVPRVSPNEELSTGQETVWSCINFGSYPSAEVVRSSWDAVDDYAVMDGDVIRDDDLYERLCEAGWSGDRVSLDGKDYIRINRENAVTAAADREQHYRWDDLDAWHYFVEEPIKWRVLSVKDGKALLLSDRILDCFPFNLTDEEVSWKTSSVRSWLNGYDSSQNSGRVDYSGKGFLDHAFTPDEREAIVQTDCTTPDNLDYGTDSGPDTKDYVFLLSNEEVYADDEAADYGFYAGRGYDDPSKRFTATMYAKCRGSWWSPVDAYKGNSFWFMRTSGYTPYNVTYICDFGYVYSRGTAVTCDDAGILPAVTIDLAAADFEDAGEVSSADIVKKPDTDSTKTSDNQMVLQNPVTEADDSLPGGMAVTWDKIAFGSYPQTEILEKGDVQSGRKVDPELFHELQKAEWDGDELDLNGKRYRRIDDRYFRYDPIIWRVLNVSEDSALLLSTKALDCMPYYNKLEDVNWDRSDVRSWLNGLGAEANLSGKDYSGEGDGFLSGAFSENERLSILESDVQNANNHYFGTSCGPDTEDQVFLLSEDEIFSSSVAADYGFRDSDAVADPAKRFLPTAYAVCRGAWQSELEESAGNTFWILRSNGYTDSNVVYVGEAGYIFNRGIPVTCQDAGLIPAIRIDLKTAAYAYRGTVTSRDLIPG